MASFILELMGVDSQYGECLENFITIYDEVIENTTSNEYSPEIPGVVIKSKNQKTSDLDHLAKNNTKYTKQKKQYKNFKTQKHNKTTLNWDEIVEEDLAEPQMFGGFLNATGSKDVSSATMASRLASDIISADMNKAELEHFLTTVIEAFKNSEGTKKEHSSSSPRKGFSLGILDQTDIAISDKIKGMRYTIDEYISGFQEKLDEKSEDLTKVVLYIVLLAILISSVALKKKYLLLLGVPVVFKLAQLHQVNSAIADIKTKTEHIIKFLNNNSTEPFVVVEPQAGSYNPLTFIPTMLFGVDFVNNIRDNNGTAFTTRNYNTVKVATKDFIDFALFSLKHFMECLGFGANYDAILARFNGQSDFVDYTKSVLDIELKIADKRFPYTCDNYNVLKELVIKGETLVSSLKHTVHGSGLSMSVSSALARVRKFKDTFESSGFQVDGLRQEPVGVLFRGGPGIFKTQTMHHLNHAILGAIATPETIDAINANPEMYIYNRLVEHEYWDGYDSNKIITMFDDLLQLKDIAGGSTTEPHEIIRAINENNFILHMAELKSKGNTHFNSKFVFATTNSSTLQANSIISPDALTRRFTYVFTVEPKPEYAIPGKETGMTAKVDKAKLPLGPLGFTDTDPETILQFRKFDLTTMTSSSEVYSYEQVVSMILNAYKDKKNFFDQKLLKLKEQRMIHYAQSQMNWKRISNYFRNPLMEHLTQEKFYDTVFNQKDMSNWQMDALTRYVEEYIDGLEENINVSYSGDIIYYLRSLSYQAAKAKIDLFEFIINHIISLNRTATRYEIYHGLLAMYGPWFLKDLNVSILSDFNRRELTNIVTADYNDYITCKDSFFPSVRAVKGYYNNLSSQVFSCVEKIRFSKHFIILKTISKILGMSAIAYGLYKVIRYLGSQLLGQEDDSEVEEESGGGRKISRTGKQISRKSYKRAAPQISLVSDDQCRSIMHKIIKSSMLEVHIRHNGTAPYDKIGQLLIINNTITLMPHHFVDTFVDMMEEFKDTAQIRLTGLYSSTIDTRSQEWFVRDFIGYNVDGTEEVFNNIYDTDNLLAQDLSVVNVPDLTPGPDLRKYIISQSYLDSLNTKHKSTLYLSKNAQALEITECQAVRIKELAVSSIDYQPYTISKCFMYNVATRKGDCGVVAALADKKNPVSKICGMHVAGTPKQGKGYASVFSREDIDEVMELIAIEVPRSVAIIGDEIIPEQQSDMPIFSGFPVLETEVEGVSIPAKSQLIKSPMYETIAESVMAPSFLAPQSDEFSENNPWVKAYSSYNMMTGPSCSVRVTQAAKEYGNMLFCNSELPEPRLFTFDEAVLGIEGTTFRSLSRGTSAGFPDITNPKVRTTGRKFYFGNGHDFDLSNENAVKLKSDVLKIIEKARRGERSMHVFTDYLKDELRDRGKVKEKKTRLFSAGPLRLLIAYRMLFGSFMNWFYDNRIMNQSSIGVNVYSAEWDVIAKLLLQNQTPGVPGIGAGDFSKFDGSEKRLVHNTILDIIDRYYDDDDESRMARYVLWQELTNSRHYFNKDIVSWSSSLPSGHPLTSMVNNMYNGIAFRYCWNRIFEDKPEEGLFDNYCYLITMGDDNVFSVPQEYVEFFNEASLSKYMKELGLTYTKEDKTMSDTSLRFITEVEFLKRKWRYDTTLRRYVAPLKIKGLIETLSWTRMGKYEHEIPVDKVDTALRELSFHDENLFTQYSEKIIRSSATNLDYFPSITSYKTLKRIVADSELIL